MCAHMRLCYIYLDTKSDIRSRFSSCSVTGARPPGEPTAGLLTRPPGVMTVVVSSAGEYVGRTPSCQSRTYSCPCDQVPGTPPAFWKIARQRFRATFSAMSNSFVIFQLSNWLVSFSKVCWTAEGPNVMPSCWASSNATWLATERSERRARNCATAAEYALLSGYS